MIKERRITFATFGVISRSQTWIYGDQKRIPNTLNFWTPLVASTMSVGATLRFIVSVQRSSPERTRFISSERLDIDTTRSNIVPRGIIIEMGNAGVKKRIILTTMDTRAPIVTTGYSHDIGGPNCGITANLPLCEGPYGLIFSEGKVGDPKAHLW
ncbi:hypothetical protein FRC19_009078 [Serendipita sp. 401]|nr:hypothetical protein FRC19_009078 [Serendipita sp. 401]